MRRAQMAWKASIQTVTSYYTYQAEPPLDQSMRLRLEINTAEAFTVYGYETRTLEVKSEWFSGKADIRSFSLDELLGTKLHGKASKL